MPVEVGSSDRRCSRAAGTGSGLLGWVEAVAATTPTGVVGGWLGFDRIGRDAFLTEPAGVRGWRGRTEEAGFPGEFLAGTFRVRAGVDERGSAGGFRVTEARLGFGVGAAAFALEFLAGGAVRPALVPEVSDRIAGVRSADFERMDARFVVLVVPVAGFGLVLARVGFGCGVPEDGLALDRDGRGFWGISGELRNRQACRWGSGAGRVSPPSCFVQTDLQNWNTLDRMAGRCRDVSSLDC